jgi:hypothetical protein
LIVKDFQHFILISILNIVLQPVETFAALMD